MRSKVTIHFEHNPEPTFVGDIDSKSGPPQGNKLTTKYFLELDAMNTAIDAICSGLLIESKVKISINDSDPIEFIYYSANGGTHKFYHEFITQI